MRNNIFALSKKGQICVIKRKIIINAFTRNIVVSKNAAIYNRVKTGLFRDNENLYWDYCRKFNIFSSGIDYYDFWEVHPYPLMMIEGYYKNAVVKDPLFADIDNLDFTVCPNSPALDMGFVPWDYSAAGIQI